MRIKLTLTRTNRHCLLPMDYPYYIHSWIYKVVEKANSEFATFLHDRGYGEANKPYKLFCFDKLNLGKVTLLKDERLLLVKKKDITLQVSFYIDKAAGHFIKGLFKDQECYIGNKEHGLDLKVTQVTLLDQPTFAPKMHYRLTTPWVVGVKTDNNPIPQYKYIDDGDNYIQPALKHIIAKMNTQNETQYTTDEIALELDQVFRNKDGVNVKPDSHKPVKVIGSRFSFWLHAPTAVHQMIWNAGISEKSAMGFGWLEMVPERLTGESK